MMNPSCLFPLLIGGALFGAPHESLAIQEMRVSLDQVGYQVHSHQIEIDLFQERLDRLEKSLDILSRQLKQGKQESAVENRLAKLERAHDTLISDIKSLRGHLNETNSSLASCQAKLSQIDKQLSSDIKGLKSSLESMLALLQKGEPSPETSALYVVKPGDSLGQIALDHKTDIKTLKQVNNLVSDTIYVGQKLILPQ